MADLEGGTGMRKLGHLLLVPSIAGHAHLMTSLRLVKVLIEMGVTITIAAQQSAILHIQSKPSFAGLQNLHLVRLAETGKVVGGPLTKSYQLETVFKPYAEKLIANKKAGVLGPTSIMADRYLMWTKGIAEELEIPLYVMFSNCAVFARLVQALQESHARGDVVVEGDKFLNFEDVERNPGLEFLRSEDLPWSMYAQPQAYVTIGEVMAGAAGVVVNSFFELQEHAINTFLKKDNDSVKVPALYPVGPLSCLGSEVDDEESYVNSETSGSNGLEWLDTQPVSSVLYICLGSWVPMFAPQVRELALALEASNQRFLWVLPPRSGNFRELGEVLPPGFQARVGDRGMFFIGWISQMKVLCHPAVSGFVSHCGWQSCLEAITAGIPVLAWPQSGEQHLNARSVSHYLDWLSKFIFR